MKNTELKIQAIKQTEIPENTMPAFNGGVGIVDGYKSSEYKNVKVGDQVVILLDYNHGSTRAIVAEVLAMDPSVSVPNDNRISLKYIQKNLDVCPNETWRKFVGTKISKGTLKINRDRLDNFPNISKTLSEG